MPCFYVRVSAQERHNTVTLGPVLGESPKGVQACLTNWGGERGLWAHHCSLCLKWTNAGGHRWPRWSLGDQQGHPCYCREGDQDPEREGDVARKKVKGHSFGGPSLDSNDAKAGLAL